MNRRSFLQSISGGLALTAVENLPAVYSSEQSQRKRLGIAQFSYNIRLRAERSGKVKGRLADPLGFLDHCHKIDAGGVQMDIGVRDKTYVRKLRRQAQNDDMFIEGSTGLPRDPSEVEKFEAVVRVAKEAGAKVIRVAIGGRRYEQFEKAEEFRAFAERTWNSLQLAEPVVARHHMRLAIENHKDFRIDQMLGMLRRIDSEYIGVCVDTGNSFALLEDPMEVIEAYAPYAFSAHLKDMVVAEYEEGFLLADVPLGQGLLDLPRIVHLLKQARPEIQFSLEMATRDPLKVPCLTEKYWATFENVPGSDLARTLRYVRANASPKRLPKVNHLPLNQLIELEEDNIKECLVFARNRLDL
jgi:sugar phosphate isomerase/epimerase